MRSTIGASKLPQSLLLADTLYKRNLPRAKILDPRKLSSRVRETQAVRASTGRWEAYASQVIPWQILRLLDRPRCRISRLSKRSTILMYCSALTYTTQPWIPIASHVGKSSGNVSELRCLLPRTLHFSHLSHTREERGLKRERYAQRPARETLR